MGDLIEGVKPNTQTNLQVCCCRDEHQSKRLPVDLSQWRGTLRSLEGGEGQRGGVPGRAEGDAGGTGETDPQWRSDCSWCGERGGRWYPTYPTSSRKSSYSSSGGWTAKTDKRRGGKTTRSSETGTREKTTARATETKRGTREKTARGTETKRGTTKNTTRATETKRGTGEKTTGGTET